MFNDELTQTQCESLLQNLADSMFPFQCAHGRPSLVPLLDLGIYNTFGAENRGSDSRSKVGFGRAFRRWKDGSTSKN